ncbi:MAG TPA: PadR family transcriptional regulator [Streptosporangiaceae bacterium]
MASKRPVSNLLGLAVLCYLSEQPLHPYALGRMLRQHGDARSIKFNHGSLYMVVQQLARAGFVAEHETGREGARPEHTVYALTDAGRLELTDWLHELLGQPRHEYPAFVAALSLMAALPPAEVAGLLRNRLTALAGQRAEITGLIETSAANGVPGLFLIEEEYRLAQLDTEVAFTERLIASITDPGTDWALFWAGQHGVPFPAVAPAE